MKTLILQTTRFIPLLILSILVNMLAQAAHETGQHIVFHHQIYPVDINRNRHF